jgi:hypothetical protein
MNRVRILAVGLLFWISGAAGAPSAPPSPGGLYDADPKHLWNRLNEALFVRVAPDDSEQFGSGELDILFWDTTKHLLTSPSHERALNALDEFIRTHGERLIRDPVKRALLQRDLWQLFDWSAVDDASRPRVELQQRLVTVMKRLALSAEEIARLPDNYAEADAQLEAAGFPHGLFQTEGPWLPVGRPFAATASEHSSSFDNRSVFMVFVSFPEGRGQALQYLQQLREFTPAMIYAKETHPRKEAPSLVTNPATPQFPVNTRWALVRRLCLIDDQGRMRATPLIESIQTRTYAAIPEVGRYVDFPELRAQQPAAEFQLDRRHAAALRVVADDERDFQFVHFRSMGVDQFEYTSAADWARWRDRIRDVTLRTCVACHQGPGILSVNTYTTFMMTANRLGATTPERESEATISAKSRRFDWGLLQGLWRR